MRKQIKALNMKYLYSIMKTIGTAVLLFCTTHTCGKLEDHFLTNLHPVSQRETFKAVRKYGCLSLTHVRSNNAEEGKICLFRCF